jgi:hypothetical protein
MTAIIIYSIVQIHGKDRKKTKFQISFIKKVKAECLLSFSSTYLFSHIPPIQKL